MGDLARIIPLPNSLVKYGNPFIVSKKDDTAPKLGKIKHSFPLSGRKDSGLNKETEEILNCILPPRQWEEDGLLWRQKVSTDPATRLDVIKLAEMLDYRMQERQARESGICPIRREIFSQCFEEIIRQVTVNCAERGLLLLRVRDELYMTIKCYQALFESSVAYGIRKVIMSDVGKEENEELIKKLKDEKKQLQDQIELYKLNMEYKQSRFDETRSIDKKLHEEEMEQLKRANEQLKAQLKAIIAPKKSNWTTNVDKPT